MLTFGNIQENMTLRSLTRIGVHEALVLAQTFIILEKLLNRVCLEKTGEMRQPKQAKTKYINGHAFFKSFPVKLKIRPKNMAITKAMSAV